MTEPDLEPEIPKEIQKPCHTCGTPANVLNGEYYQQMRLACGLTLEAMARRCFVSITQLTEMEHGRRKFKASCAEVYERADRRRRMAGDPT